MSAKHPPGRPSDLAAEVERAIIEAVADGATIAQAAAVVGVS